MGLHYAIVRAFIWYTLCDQIFSKRHSFSDLDKRTFENLDECQRCKVLTDSFNHWLDKTSRGKFEGGDAAWEEAKLKSYARSEIRLVEIQEGLCSEVKSKDHCYSLADEAEQALEKWWFHEDPSSADLHTWLCIETLKHCCPQNHFGDLCSPCPLDINNKVCGGHGRCDGDGTRKGTGACKCKAGYAGKQCEECSKNFYSAASGSCEQCHRSCDDCSGEGAAACVGCRPGWQLESGSCVDVNECSDLSNCEPGQYCVNREGSHTCNKCDKSCETCTGAGSSNCTSCNTNYVSWSGICVDDEQKGELLVNTLIRVALYCGLLLITVIMCRHSTSLASLVILVIALYIYHSEKSSKMNIINVILNVLFK